MPLSSYYFFLKCLLASLLIFSTVGKAQQFALLDRGLKIPFTYVDSVSFETFGKGIFPIYLEEIKPVILAVEDISKKINQSRYESAESFIIPTGHSKVILHVDVYRQTKKYTLLLTTEVNGYATYIELVKGTYDRIAQQRVIAFIEYLRNNVESITKISSGVW